MFILIFTEWNIFSSQQFADMMEKYQWIILPATMIKKLFGLQLIPIGLVTQLN